MVEKSYDEVAKELREAAFSHLRHRLFLMREYRMADDILQVRHNFEAALGRAVGGDEKVMDLLAEINRKALSGSIPSIGER